MLRVLSVALSLAPLASATDSTSTVSLSRHSLAFDAEDAKKNRPVSKVITLLKDMQKQLEKDQEEDEEIYNKVACWCKINNKDKTLAIKEQEGKITQLTSLIEEGVANTQRLATEIENLKKEVAENTESLGKATALREKQLEEFQSEEKDLLESIGALKSAIVVLAKHNKSFLQSAAYTEAEKKKEKQMLLSLKAVYDRHHDDITAQLSPAESHKLQQLIQQAQAQAPSVAQYGNQSGEIFGILKNMKETFESNLSVAQENEKANSAAFADLKGAKQQEISAGQAQVDDKIVQLADTKERVATGRQDLEDTRNSLSADDEFLQMVQEKCSQTDAEWQERQKTRQEEIYSVSQAISVLSDDNAHDTFTKTFNPSFIQIAQVDRREAAAKALLKVKAADPKIMLIAQSIKLDAFVKVKAAIDEMVTTLQAEKAEEIKHRDFCISELNENEKTQAQLGRDHDSHVAKVDEIKASIATAKTAIKEIEGHNAEMRTQLKRAGEDRESQNSEFQATLADQRVTKKLLTQALTVLKSFYEKQTRKSAYNVAAATAEGQAAIDATNAAFIQMSIRTRRVHHGQQLKSIRKLQQPNEEILAPEEETDPIRKLENMKGAAAPGGFRTYKKNEGATSVLGLLQQIIHDTQLMEQEISNAEQQSQETYESMVKETNNSLTKNQSALVNQNQAVARSEQELIDTQADLKDTKIQMEQEANSGADLHANCDFVLKNFEIRQTARDEEVEALQQAKAILSGANFDTEP